eukprot:m.65228 g.65228  ORF g.65228 m.65228 type:complete len:85 (+) comp15910_c0_seq6:604-858(+)
MRTLPLAFVMRTTFFCTTYEWLVLIMNGQPSTISHVRSPLHVLPACITSVHACAGNVAAVQLPRHDTRARCDPCLGYYHVDRAV